MGAVAMVTVSALLISMTTTFITAAEPPIPAVSVPSPVRVSVVPGSRVRLSCKSSLGDVRLAWRHSADGQWHPGELWGDPLPPGVRVTEVTTRSGVTVSKLVIASLDESLAGFYRCLLRTSGGAAISGPALVSLIHTNSSASRVSPIRVSVATGSSLVLGCLHPGNSNDKDGGGGDGEDSDPPSRSVSAWSRAGVAAVPATPSPALLAAPRGRMRMSDVRRSDGGRYACRSPGAPPADEVAYLVSVTDPPLSASPLQELSTAPGAVAVVSCGGGGGRDLSPPRWLRDGRPLTPDPRLDEGRGLLTIAGVREGDAGVYQCLVERAGLEGSSVTRITVLTGSPSRHLSSSPPSSGASGGRESSVATSSSSAAAAASAAASTPPPPPPPPAVSPATANQSAAGAAPRAQAAAPEAPIILSPTRTHRPDSYLLQWMPGSPSSSSSSSSESGGGAAATAGSSSSSVLDFLIRYRELSEDGSVGGRWLTVRVPPDQREFSLSQLRASSLYEVEVLARSLRADGQAAMFTFRTGKERSSKFPAIGAHVVGAGQAKNDSQHGAARTSPEDGGHTVPEAPDRPTVAMASDSSAYVTWIPRANGGSPITAFHVEFRRLGGGGGPAPGGGVGAAPHHHAAGEWTVAAKGIPPSKLSVEVKGLQPGATYRFRVAASNACGESARSTASRAYGVGGASDRPSPRPVAGPYITYTDALSSSKILLKWTYTPEANNNTPIRGFYIFYRPTDSDNDSDYAENVADSEMRHHTIHSLLPETSYDIKMRVFNDGGQSEFSNVMICETKAARKPHRAHSPRPPTHRDNHHRDNHHRDNHHRDDDDDDEDRGERPSAKPSRSPEKDNGGGGGGGERSGGSGGGALLYLLLGLLLGLMVLTVLGFIALRGWKARSGARGHGNGVAAAGCVDETQLTDLSDYKCRHVYDSTPCNGLYPHGYGVDPHADISFTELPQEECRSDGRPTGRAPRSLANGVGGQGSHEASPLNSRRANDEEEEVIPMTEEQRAPSRSSADPTIDSLGDTDTEPGDGLPTADSDGERRGGVSCDSGLATQASSSPSPGHRPPLLQEEAEQQQQQHQQQQHQQHQQQ